MTTTPTPYNHTCDFRAPGYECRTCGLSLMEYTEGLEDRCEALIAERLRYESHVLELKAERAATLELLTVEALKTQKAEQERDKALARAAVLRSALSDVVSGVWGCDMVEVAKEALEGEDPAVERLLARLAAAEAALDCFRIDGTLLFLAQPGAAFDGHYREWRRISQMETP